MNSTLKNLYYGNFRPFERKVNRTVENNALHKVIHEEEHYFAQKMSTDDVKRFEQLKNLYTEANAYEEEDAFAYGFSLATLLMSAVFTNTREGDLDSGLSGSGGGYE